MSDFNSIQPITDDYYTDGYLDEYAKIDHQHPLSTTLTKKILSGSASLFNVLTPGGSIGTAAGAGFSDWFSWGSFDIPKWATKALCVVNITYIGVAGAANNVYGCRLSVGGAFGSDLAYMDYGNLNRLFVTYTAEITGFTVGNQVIKFQTRHAAGAGQWLVDTAGSNCSINIIWL